MSCRIMRETEELLGLPSRTLLFLTYHSNLVHQLLDLVWLRPLLLCISVH